MNTSVQLERLKPGRGSGETVRKDQVHSTDSGFNLKELEILSISSTIFFLMSKIVLNRQLKYLEVLNNQFTHRESVTNRY